MGAVVKVDAALADLLRERGATDDELLHLEKFDAVRDLLSWASYRDDAGDCLSCDGGRVHYRDCVVFKAWHALGMSEALGAIEAAHEVALYEHARRGGKVAGIEAFVQNEGTLFQIDRTYDYESARVAQPQTLTITGLMASLENQARNDAPAPLFVTQRDYDILRRDGVLPAASESACAAGFGGIRVQPSPYVPEGTAYMFGPALSEQTPLDDAPAVDDDDRLDVDDP